MKYLYYAMKLDQTRQDTNEEDIVVIVGGAIKE